MKADRSQVFVSLLLIAAIFVAGMLAGLVAVAVAVWTVARCAV